MFLSAWAFSICLFPLTETFICVQNSVSHLSPTLSPSPICPPHQNTSGLIFVILRNWMWASCHMIFLYALAWYVDYHGNWVGKSDEVVEIVFTKLKSTAGRVLPQQWVAGAICWETNSWSIVQADQEIVRLMIVNSKYVDCGSVMYSDSWGVIIVNS
jgi:hypothetical protein